MFYLVGAHKETVKWIQFLYKKQHIGSPSKHYSAFQTNVVNYEDHKISIFLHSRQNKSDLKCFNYVLKSVRYCTILFLIGNCSQQLIKSPFAKIYTVHVFVTLCLWCALMYWYSIQVHILTFGSLYQNQKSDLGTFNCICMLVTPHKKTKTKMFPRKLSPILR